MAAEDHTGGMSTTVLEPGYQVLWYVIERVLGRGGFGITYLAHDQNLDRKVAIKEYLPTTIAYRHNDHSVKPLTGQHADDYAWGLGSFLKEAQTLAKFSHASIVRVHSVFETNSTAYMVMDYEHGDNLASIYKQRGNLDQAFFESVFYPIFDGLKHIHQFGFIHRDIKPANIFLRRDGSAVLIDFGSARATSQQDNREMTALVTHGYNPIEQYNTNYGGQGPWTDIYALAATMNEGITGRRPEQCLSRLACLVNNKPDPVPALSSRVQISYAPQFLDAINNGLTLKAEGRPQDLDTWLAQFTSAGHSTERHSDNAVEVAKPGSDLTLDLQTRPHERLDTNGTGARSQAGYAATQGDTPASSTVLDRTRTRRPENRTAVLPPDDDDRYDRLFDDFGVGEGLEAEARHGQRAAASTRGHQPYHNTPFSSQASRQSTISPSSHKWKVAALAASVLLAVGTGVALWPDLELQQPTGEVDSAALAQLPQPPTAIATALPKELVSQQLIDLSQLASFYQQAYEIRPDDPELERGIQSAYAKLTSLASTWNASQHPDIARSVRAIAESLPGNSEQHGRLLRLLDSADQQSDLQGVLDLLAANQIAAPAGDSLLDEISRLSRTDFDRLINTDAWRDMMQGLRAAAVEQVQAREFDSAARIIEVALTMQPQDQPMRRLRSHLMLR